MTSQSRPPETLRPSPTVEDRIQSIAYEAVQRLIALQDPELEWSNEFREDIRAQIHEILQRLQENWGQTKTVRARNVVVLMGNTPVMRTPQERVGLPVLSKVDEERLTNAHTEYYILGLASAILHEAHNAATALVNDSELDINDARDLATIILTILHHAMLQNLNALAPMRQSSVPPAPGTTKVKKQAIDPAYAESPPFLADLISQYVTFRIERILRTISTLTDRAAIATLIQQEVAGLHTIINRHIDILAANPENPIYRALNKLITQERTLLK